MSTAEREQRVFLVIGSGGREHALAWRLSQTPSDVVYVAPGHDGIAADEAIRGGCVPIDAMALEALADFAQRHEVALTIVGPEAPLDAGIVDVFRARGLPIWGPCKAAAQLESSKSFAKQLMDEAGVPTAAWRRFEGFDAANQYARAQPHPLVIKADGLAAGKGVFICQTPAQSEEALREVLVQGAFGGAGASVVVEAFLQGRELSFMVAVSGEQVVQLPTSQDHKRVGEGDSGPNTGGMGAFAPSPLEDEALRATLLARVVHPTLAALRRRGIAYSGFLYVGVMWTAQGPYVLEFNVRLGDPETQALMLGLNADLGDTLLALHHQAPTSPRALCQGFKPAFCVVLAERGYPGPAQRGSLIEGLERVGADAKVFHAGSAYVAERGWVTRGGRVLSVCASGDTLSQARQRAYEAASLIQWDGMHYRRDMGQQEP